MKAAVMLSTLSTILQLSEGYSEPEDHNVNITAILDKFLIGYDKRVRPNYGNSSVTVGVTLYVLSIWDLPLNKTWISHLTCILDNFGMTQDLPLNNGLV